MSIRVITIIFVDAMNFHYYQEWKSRLQLLSVLLNFLMVLPKLLKQIAIGCFAVFLLNSFHPGLRLWFVRMTKFVAIFAYYHLHHLPIQSAYCYRVLGSLCVQQRSLKMIVEEDCFFNLHFLVALMLLKYLQKFVVPTLQLRQLNQLNK